MRSATLQDDLHVLNISVVTEVVGTVTAQHDICVMDKSKEKLLVGKAHPLTIMPYHRF